MICRLGPVAAVAIDVPGHILTVYKSDEIEQF